MRRMHRRYKKNPQNNNAENIRQLRQHGATSTSENAFYTFVINNSPTQMSTTMLTGQVHFDIAIQTGMKNIFKENKVVTSASM